MADVRDLVAEIIINAGVGVTTPTTAWSVHRGFMPESPNQVICLYLTGGLDSSPRYLLDWPSVQIRVRGAPNGAQDMASKMRDIRSCLIGFPSADVLGDRVVSVLPISNIVDLPPDESNRPRQSYNLQLIVEPAATGLDNRIPL